MQRYFIDENQVNNNFIIIIGNDFHHIQNVMRMTLGEHVYACDGKKSYLCIIDSFEKNQVNLKIEQILDEQKELKVDVTIAQGLVRKEKMEEVIDYSTELGAYAYQPIIMKRSIIKLDEQSFNKKLDRFNMIAKEASEQSHRTKIMKINPLLSWKSFLKESKKYDLCIFAYEQSPKDDSLKKLLKNKAYKSILVVIGPEGGFDDSEVEELKANNFYPVSLGPRILRTQVAPLYVLSAISYELEVPND